MNQNHRNLSPGLLVSVRNAAEACAALAGGAHVIDVKEPERGALGAAEGSTIAAVVRAVGRRVPVTAAMGELIDSTGAVREPLPGGVSFFKIGLSGCGALRGWRSRWREAIEAIGRCPQSRTCRPGEVNSPAGTLSKGRFDRAVARPVAVVYADWRAAGAPEPTEVVAAAVDASCPALLIDTWDKSAGGLFDHWDLDQVGRFVQTARRHELIVVLAGSLAGESLMAAARLEPHLVGVRTAACDGGRRGVVSAERVSALRQAIRMAAVSAHAGRRENFFLDNAGELRILET